MKQESEWLRCNNYKLRFNAVDGRTARRAAERKRRKEAKRQAKLEEGK